MGVTAVLSAILWLASPVEQPLAAPQSNDPEITTQDTQPGFTVRARANEVLVRVVVRDAKGKAVPELTKDDFRLFDSGKPQVISEFSVERSQPAAKAVEKTNPPIREPHEEIEPTAPSAGRFVAFYFDDTFLAFEDIVRTRDAAVRYLKSSLTPTDRAGIYTSSGQGDVDFTSDRDKLEGALGKLRTRANNGDIGDRCPNITDYEAYLIDEMHDTEGLTIGEQKVIVCPCGGNPKNCFNAEEQAKAAAQRIWENAQFNSRQSLRGLEALVRRLSAMPGQRAIVWVSPGFLAIGATDIDQMSRLIDQALRARVVVNALDSRGLWVFIPGGDATQQGPNLTTFAVTDSGRLASSSTVVAATETRLDFASKQIQDDVMAAVTSGTGGVFVHDTNDYDGGFRKVGALPEVSYLLAFSPKDLKYDGKYHKLKVELAETRGLSVQARRGYYAPKEAPGPKRQAKGEIDDAVYAREERSELPVEIQTQFFMLDPSDAELSVLARLDLHSVRFHKDQQRNFGEVCFTTALFDTDGNLVDGQQKTVTLRPSDTRLKQLLAGGFTLRTHFKVKPGTYVIREVVRDGGSGGMAALNRTVEIPY